MTDEVEFKIKGAATSVPEKEEKESREDTAAEATPPPASASEDGEVTPSIDKDLSAEQDGQPQRATAEEDLKRYRWCKCLCDPTQYGGDHYFLHLDTQQSRWDEPEEPYWLWNVDEQALDKSGLHHPSQFQPPSSEPDSEYTGYNPKIHGSYDPNAPYAQYHNRKRQEETMLAQGYAPGTTPEMLSSDYGTSGTFNRFTGNFQGAEKSAERHTDHNKSGRQMNAYFDVDSAANMHDGRSLKEERRNEKLSKKQIKELADKRRAKKEKKRMDFYKS